MVFTCLAVTGAYPTMILLGDIYLQRWAGPFGFDLLYPPLWGVFCMAALAGTLVAYPFHLWMIRRGVIRWGAAPEESTTRKQAWYLQAVLFLIAFAVMIAALILSVRLSIWIVG